MSSVDDLIITGDLDTGVFTIYERMLDPKKMLLVKEFPSRADADADAYIQHQRDMDEVYERLGESFETMVSLWITGKAKETGLEPRLVREFIGGIID